MDFNPSLWHRMEMNGVPIYVRKDASTWFVPNTAGDRILTRLDSAPGVDPDWAARRFLDRLPDSFRAKYPGRADLLKLSHLRELWFHLTNRCNMSCAHCMFDSAPDVLTSISGSRVLEIARQASALGCRVFALTGGEPLTHPDFSRIVSGLLLFDAVHVAVLTNGLGLRKFLTSTAPDLDRFHLQISMDGLEESHDRIRGEGMFARLMVELDWLKRMRIPFTLSMCVTADNASDMPEVIEFAHKIGAKNVHYMWYFIRGRGSSEAFVLPDLIFPHLCESAERAESLGVRIDNLESLKTQVFAPSGTLHDGGTAGWESIAVGPDARLYPSAALVGVESLATELHPDLATAWAESPVLERVRHASVRDLSAPLRFLLGGGDMDHSFLSGGSFVGDDPYTPLHEKMALRLIASEAKTGDDHPAPGLRLKMGDRIESCGAHGTVALAHSNCLLAWAQKDSLTVVKEFYSRAAADRQEDILNPVAYPDERISHIPVEFRFRGYGCGSPVFDAAIEEGERVLDLGCGTGVECFVAAGMVGVRGKVIGIDMLDPMLELARRGAAGVAQNLGYENTSFKKGYLEDLPLENSSFNVVLSNCVMNLSTNKRRAFREAFRVLRDGGRLVMSDVVCETEPDGAIRNDEKLQGECIAGALTERDLVGILEESGFHAIRFLKRFPYRTVHGHPFFSLTFEARRPLIMPRVKAMYRGPLAMALTHDGNLLRPGIVADISEEQADLLGEQIFRFGDQGEMTNLSQDSTCACCAPAEEGEEVGDGCGCACFSPAESVEFSKTPPAEPSMPSSLSASEGPSADSAAARQRSGCMLCGAPLLYLSSEEEKSCAFCGDKALANAVCQAGHFVCDRCHGAEALEVVERALLGTRETDMLALLSVIRRHGAIPLHGPEHHALVPGIILATYRNLGGGLTDEIIRSGISRGSKVSGGHCGFMGVCGAALGVGVAFSLILEANPLKPAERKMVQSAVWRAMEGISSLEAARCCQRDAWLALRQAAVLSREYLPLPLRAEAKIKCGQRRQNAECIGDDCPLLRTC